MSLVYVTIWVVVSLGYVTVWVVAGLGYRVVLQSGLRYSLERVWSGLCAVWVMSQSGLCPVWVVTVWVIDSLGYVNSGIKVV